MNIFSYKGFGFDEGERVDEISSSSNVRIERIISRGHASDDGFWYDQDFDEFVCVIEGSALLEFEDAYVIMQKGDTLMIPKHLKHRVKYTDKYADTLWLCVNIY